MQTYEIYMKVRPNIATFICGKSHKI